MPRIRRLGRVMPVTLMASAALLTLKLAEISRAAQPAMVGAIGVSAPAAPQASSPPPKPAPMAASMAMPSAEPGAGAMPMTAPTGGEPAISPAERQLLQDLRTRRAELDAREHTLEQRESVLAAAEHRLTGRIAEMAALQARLEQLEGARHEHDDANWAGLVKVYETMKPREAAAIFNDMDMPVMIEVIDRMKDAKAAQILGAMQPDRARQVTAQLAAQRTRSTTVPPERPGAG